MTDHTHDTIEQRQRAMNEALRAWDPDAEVTIEADTGRLIVVTSLPNARVIAILKDIGEHAKVTSEEPHERQPSQCCGECSH